MNMSSCLFVLSINYLTVGSVVMEQQCWVVGVLTLNASCQSLIHKHVLPGNRIKHQVLPASDQEMWNWQGAYWSPWATKNRPGRIEIMTREPIFVCFCFCYFLFFIFLFFFRITITGIII